VGAVAVALALVAGCGESDDETAGVPATAEESESGYEPGAPVGDDPDYAGLGTWWTKLSTKERLDSAADFIEDHPADCDGVSAKDLERQAGIALGYDFPDAAPMDQVMLETCALIRDGV
jgi:hypothetical protein